MSFEIPSFYNEENKKVNCTVRLNSIEQIYEYESKIEIDKELYPVYLKMKGFFFLKIEHNCTYRWN